MRIFLALVILFCASTCEAKVYVCVDKVTGDPQGMADISDEAVSDWSTRFDLKEADESFRGKQPYEMKKDGDKIRHATEAEIEVYKQAQEEAGEVQAKENALKILGLTAKDLEKIKKLPDEVTP